MHLKTYDLKYYFPYARYLPTYDLNKYPPKVIVYSSITSEYLIEHARELRQDFGFDGFILLRLPSSGWPGNYQKLIPLTGIVRKGNQVCAANGIKNNFLKISFEQGDFPFWLDNKKWAADLKEIKAVCAWARQTGFAGIAFDTETYHKIIWNNGLPRNKVQGIERIIELRGQQTVKAVLAGFPDAEIIVMPEGHLFSYTTKGPHKYAYWIHFFNGMLKARPPRGINLFAERTYKVSDQLKLRQYYREIQGEIIGDNVSDPEYWLNKCSVALGMWPLGREYNDKRANLTTLEFDEQFNTAIQFCPKYVWVYAHGLSWWQTNKGSKYKFEPMEAALPTVKNISDYKKIILNSKKEDLKYYYKEIKYNKRYSYLNRIFDRLF